MITLRAQAVTLPNGVRIPQRLYFERDGVEVSEFEAVEEGFEIHKDVRYVVAANVAALNEELKKQRKTNPNWPTM